MEGKLTTTDLRLALRAVEFLRDNARKHLATLAELAPGDQTVAPAIKTLESQCNETLDHFLTLIPAAPPPPRPETAAPATSARTSRA